MKIANRIAFLAAISSVCGTAGAAALTVNVSDSSGRPLADVVVVAETPAGAALPRQARQIEIEQRGLKFLPLVSVIQTGSKIAFPNNDKVKHHIYSFSPAKNSTRNCTPASQPRHRYSTRPARLSSDAISTTA